MKSFVLALMLLCGCGSEVITDVNGEVMSTSDGGEELSPVSNGKGIPSTCGTDILVFRDGDGRLSTIQVPVPCDPHVNYREGYPVDRTTVGSERVNPVDMASPVK